MNKNILQRFIEGKLKGKPLEQLQQQISRDEDAVWKIIEEDWQNNADFEQDWPATRWENLEHRLEDKSRKKSNMRSLSVAWWMKVAAAMVMAISVWFVFRNIESNNQTADNPGMITKMNHTNRIKQIELKDGTKVVLTSHSSISYYKSFNAKYRVVHLKGEARFITDGINQRPFVVISDNITSICRGKEFTISAFTDEDEISVTPTSGQIEIARNDKLNSETNKIEVRSCERYSYNKISSKSHVGKIANCGLNVQSSNLLRPAARDIVL